MNALHRVSRAALMLAAAAMAASCAVAPLSRAKPDAAAAPAGEPAPLADVAGREIRFHDRFDRMPSDDEPWRVVRGTFQLESTTNRMTYNTIPVTNKHWIKRWMDLRAAGPELWVQRSPNAIRYFGKAKDWGLAVAGDADWTGYRYEVSMRSFCKALGVVFAYRAPNDCFLLHWDLKTLHDAPAAVTLLRLTPQGPRVLSRRMAVGAVGQWYRFRIDLDGRRVCAYIDECRVADVMLDQPPAGKIGLYVEGERGASIDDVDVVTLKRHRLDRPEVLPRAEGWKVNADASLTPTSDAPYRFAPRAWGKVFTFRAEPPAGPWAFDILLGQDAAGREAALRLRAGERIEVSLAAAGAAPAPQTAPESVKPRRAHEFTVDLSAPGFVKLYIDDLLVWRGAAPEGLVPRFGFARAAGGVRLQPLEIAGRRDEELQQQCRVPIFVGDPFMLQWSSPEGYWMPVEGEPNTYWHKSDFFGRYAISLPLPRRLTIAFALDQRGWDRGYRLDLSPVEPPALLDVTGRKPSAYRLRLKRLERVVAAEQFPAPAGDERLTLHKDGLYIWVTVGDREVLTFRDPHPLPGRQVGLRSPDKIDPHRIRVARNHVKDDFFQTAPADWRSVGWWDIHNRFDCYPHWQHFLTRTRGVSILWNKCKFEGDFTFEYYAGQRMRPWKRWSWYPRLGDENCMFCGDGRDLSAAYKCIIAAWDPTWSGTWSRLMKGLKTVAQTDQPLIPNRATKYRRPLFVPYIRMGPRPYHGAWYYVRVRRIGRRIEVSVEDKPAMTYDSPEPLPDGFLGLWTLDDFTVFARASVSFERMSRPSLLSDAPAPQTLPPSLAAMADFVTAHPNALAPLPPPPVDQRYDLKTVWGEYYGGFRADTTPPDLAKTRALRVASSTHPGLWFDFDDGLQGWKPQEDVTDAALRLAPRGRPGDRCLRVVNVGQGGLFGAAVALRPLPLDRASRLCFDYKIDPRVKINFYLKIDGQWYFVRLTGPNTSHDLMRRLGAVDAKVGEWTHADFDLAAALAAVDPFRTDWTLEELFVGELHEGYLRAGFGGNPDRAEYRLDNVQIISRGGPRFEATATAADSDTPPAVTYAVTRPGDESPASLRAAADGRIAADGLAPGRWVLRVRSASGDAARLPFEVEASPARVAALAPADAARWGGGPIVLQFESRGAALPRLAGARLRVNEADYPLNASNCRFEAEKRRLVVDSSRFDWRAAQGERVDFELNWPAGPPEAVAHWFVIGPFDNENDSAFERVDPPEREVDVNASCLGKDGETLSWRELKGQEVVDGAKLFAVDHCSFFAAAFLDCDRDRPGTRFLLGCDDWARVWVNGQPAFEKLRSGGYTRDEFEFEADLHRGRNVVLVEVGDGVGEWKFGLRVAAPRRRFAWSYTADRGLDLYPPSRPEIEGRLADIDFEDGLRTWRPNGSVVTLDDSTAAQGRYCARMTNPRLQGRCGAAAFRRRCNLGRFPILSFDYWFNRYSRADVVVDTRAYGPRSIRLTDDDNNLGQLGEFENVQSDGRWRRAEINVAGLLAARPFARNMFEADGVEFGDWGYGFNGPTSTYRIDNFSLAQAASCREGLRVKWSARDLFGVRGYSFRWSDKPFDEPDETIDSTESEVVFHNLPEGDRYLHARACDAAGNWSATRHFRYLIDNTPPEVETLKPAPTARIGDNRFLVKITDALSRVDPTSLEAAVGKTRVKLDAPLARYDPASGELAWDWALGAKFGSGPVKDGAAVTFTLAAVRDHAGNAAATRTWSAVIDFSCDRCPPAAPEMIVAPPYFRFHAFSAEFGDWRSYGSAGAVVTRVFDRDKQDYCLQLKTEVPGREAAASMCLAAYDARKYPFVAFQYKLPRGLRAQVRARVKGKWYYVRLADSAYRQTNIGSIPGAKADGKWRWACFDLGGMLDKRLKHPSELRVEQLVIGCWSRTKNPPGSSYRVDNFAIFGRGAGEFAAEWVGYDATGVQARAVVIDRKPDTTPAPRAGVKAPPVLRGGPWYVHARVQDGAGNWGPASHAPYYGPASDEERLQSQD